MDRWETGNAIGYICKHGQNMLADLGYFVHNLWCALAAVGGSVDSPSKRKKLKARKMPKNARPTHRQLRAVLGGSSGNCSITEENHTTAKAAFLQKLEL